MNSVYIKDDIAAENLFKAWLVAAENGDASWFEDHLAPEFIYLNSGGGRLDRESLIASNQLTENKYTLVTAEGRCYGNLLISLGIYSAKGVIPMTVDVSQSLRDKYARGLDMRFLQVWRKEGERFLCVVLQTTEISKG